MLLQEFRKVADDAHEHGFIVFTLGSNAQVSFMPDHIREAFVRAFARLPQTVIWRWEKDTIPAGCELSPNVKTFDWLPQQDLLGDSSTLLA